MVNVINNEVDTDDQNNTNDKVNIYSTKTQYVADIIAMIVFIGLIVVTYKYNPIGFLFVSNNLTAIRIQYLSMMLYFIIFVFIVYYYDLFYASTSYKNVFIFFTLLVSCFLFAILTYYFVAFSKNDIYQSGLSKFPKNVIELFQYAIGIIVFILIVIFIIILLTSQSTTFEIIFNILIIFTLLTLLYNILSKSAIFRSSPIFRLIISILLYIPCLFAGIFDTIISQYYIEKERTRIQEVILLVISIILIVIYFVGPYFMEWITSKYQGGKLLVNEPIILNNPYTIGAYIPLNDINANDNDPLFEYNYAVSMWLYLDAMPPNTNASLDKYTPVFSYGGKPTISYKASNNTMLITAKIKDLTAGMLDNLNLNMDEHGDVIIYKLDNVLLQKWNHILINYNGGVLDVFYNGELVKSAKNIVPYMALDSMVVGSSNGINGAICNVVYYNYILDANQISHLYNSVKNNTPPTRSFAPSNQEINESNITTPSN